MRRKGKKRSRNSGNRAFFESHLPLLRSLGQEGGVREAASGCSEETPAPPPLAVTSEHLLCAWASTGPRDTAVTGQVGPPDTHHDNDNSKSQSFVLSRCRLSKRSAPVAVPRGCLTMSRDIFGYHTWGARGDVLVASSG